MDQRTKIKASDLLVNALENEGVEYIFGIPGEENLDFLDSLSRSQKIKLVLTRHEQAAGFMAATYGRHTGKTGVCLSTLGPGATNFFTAAGLTTAACGCARIDRKTGMAFVSVIFTSSGPSTSMLLMRPKLAFM